MRGTSDPALDDAAAGGGGIGGGSASRETAIYRIDPKVAANLNEIVKYGDYTGLHSILRAHGVIPCVYNKKMEEFRVILSRCTHTKSSTLDVYRAMNAAKERFMSKGYSVDDKLFTSALASGNMLIVDGYMQERKIDPDTYSPQLESFYKIMNTNRLVGDDLIRLFTRTKRTIIAHNTSIKGTALVRFDDTALTTASPGSSPCCDDSPSYHSSSGR